MIAQLFVHYRRVGKYRAIVLEGQFLASGLIGGVQVFSLSLKSLWFRFPHFDDFAKTSDVISQEKLALVIFTERPPLGVPFVLRGGVK